MRYARIFDVHIPLARTDLVFKCTEYEVALAKSKWEGTQQRAKDRAIVVTPMSLTGPHDPFRPVESAEDEMRRLKNVWGRVTFEKTYATETFVERFEQKTVEQNAWSIARAKAEAEAQAEKQGLAAAATAELVHQAIERRVKADAEAAARRSGKADEAQDQADKDRETLAAVGVADEAFVGADAPRSPTKGRKA